jgi:hypothetical protein
MPQYSMQTCGDADCTNLCFYNWHTFYQMSIMQGSTCKLNMRSVTNKALTCQGAVYIIC